jgi:hypothetical protein
VGCVRIFVSFVWSDESVEISRAAHIAVANGGFVLALEGLHSELKNSLYGSIGAAVEAQRLFACSLDACGVEAFCVTASRRPQGARSLSVWSGLPPTT